MELTAIKQEWVDESKDLKETMLLLHQFLIDNKLITEDGKNYYNNTKFAFLTW